MYKYIILSFLLLTITGCNGFSVEGSVENGTVQPTAGIATATLEGVLEATATRIPEQDSVEPATNLLRVWVPPDFDPAAQTPAGELLQARLAAFIALHPGVEIDVRVKSPQGPGGLFDSLSTASAAAPLALPDLIALPRPLLESAALKGLLFPYDTLTNILEDADWYDYARQLAYLQESMFGLPFSGDVLLLVYESTSVTSPSMIWNASDGGIENLAFPASDHQALFTLLLYQAVGGRVRDDQGRPTLDLDALNLVLKYYHEKSLIDVIPYWLTQYESNEQVWDVFLQGQVSSAAIWASSYLKAETLVGTQRGALAPLVTPDGQPFSLADGWVWALASVQPDRQRISVALAEFLVEEEFLAEWTLAAGLIPPRANSLAIWPDSELRTTIGQIALSAVLIPSTDILSSLGPVLRDAVVQVIKQQADPQIAAQSAVDTFRNP
jgi:ABC-type glycerol-3-phosphate transport system substrate-binding protein